MLNKIKNKIIDRKIIMNLLLIFIAIEPIIDLYFLFDEKYMILGFAIPTLVRLLGIFVLGLMFLLTIKKREFILYLSYILIIIIYVFFHHLNALNFTDFYDDYDFGYNLVSEVFYIIRMLIPLAIIVITSHENISDKKLNNLLFILILLICGSIIFSNIFVISTGSYSKEKIKGSILCWFVKDKCNLTYFDLASKGFFLDANRISALLVLITPLCFYVFLKKPNLKNIIMLILNMLGMFMLGTKVSTFGFVIILLISIIIYLYFCFIKKEYAYKFKTFSILSIIFIASLLLIPISPAVNRTLVDAEIINSYEEERKDFEEKQIAQINATIRAKYLTLNNNLDSNLTEIEMLNEFKKEDQQKILKKFIKDNYEEYRINPGFIEKSYPYNYDLVFWYEIMTKPVEERINYRTLEQNILTRIKNINNNPRDNYLGITFTRMGNIFDLERDFISHYYTLGIIGLILILMPYIIILLICSVKIVLNYEKYFTSKNIFCIMGIGIALCAAYFSGNVMDSLIVSIILGFIIGILINNIYFDLEEN